MNFPHIVSGIREHECGLLTFQTATAVTLLARWQEPTKHSHKHHIPSPRFFFKKKLYALFLICVYMYDVPFVDARGQHGRVGFLLPPLYDSRLLGFCCKKLYRICHLTRSNPLRDSVSFPEEWGRLGGKDVVPNSSWFIISSLIV